MPIVRCLVTILLLLIVLSACTTASEQPRTKILCPACGTEFDALFEKRF